MNKRKILATLVVTLLIIGVSTVIYVAGESLGPRKHAADFVTRRVETNVLQPGESLLIEWLGDPIIFSKNSEGAVSSFIGISTYRNCAVVYSPPGSISDNWEGGWTDPCHLGAWDEYGKFLPGVNSGDNMVLDDLPIPKELSWEGTVAVLQK